jgi:hypothetical protein
LRAGDRKSPDAAAAIWSSLPRGYAFFVKSWGKKSVPQLIFARKYRGKIDFLMGIIR